ncbi:MAG: OmpA family protein [Chitinophagaceae bacterium]|nr:OmpA family protein [Chitinophagaceae bacterium]
MFRVTLHLLFISLTTANAQQPVTDSFPRIATVNVTVTNMQLKPQKGEEVIFKGERTDTLIRGFSNAAGKIKIMLPPDDKYTVSLKAISDSTKYAVVSIPALAEDEYFTDPYTVTIKFELARKYRLDNVHFDVDKATLRPDSYEQLTDLFEYLQRHPEIKVEIAGHTDNTGTDAHNLKLSQDRANTIRNYLLKKGIKPTQVTAKGYGAGDPVADNGTEEGRQLNRRTEVRVL